MRKRILSMIMAIAMLFMAVPYVYANETTAETSAKNREDTAELAEATSGTYGENLTWTLDNEGTLTISGTGAITDYYYDAPWNSSRENIKSVVIEEGVTRIGYEAFNYFSSLTNITIPSGVTSIGERAFEGCSSLTSVTIPSGVTSIGDYTFYDCSTLTSITIPNSVTSIEYSAFSGTALYNNEENWNNNILYIYNCLIDAKTDIVGDYEIRQGIVIIADSAFSGCSNLTNITIPDSVTSIGYSAFEGCSNLTSITIPDSVTSIGDNAFFGCSSLTSITIPDSVTSIGHYAFEDCSSLTSITIPYSVTSIGDNAFYNCSSLTSITIPKGVTSIGGGAFSGTALYNNEDNWDNNVLYINNCLIAAKSEIEGDCEIRQGTVAIAKGAFFYRSSLTSVTIPDSVTSIGEGAFHGCSSLTNITMPDSVTSIDGEVFSGCNSLTSVTIPDGAKNIGAWMFNNCSGLKNITIPDSVTSIDRYAFSGCSSLTSITIPDSVTSIGEGAFSDCSNLTSITIPSGVTSIGHYAFGYCSSLTSITIPDSVTSIGYWPFYDCSSLTDIYYSGTEAQWNKISIGGDNEALINAVIHFLGTGDTTSPSINETAVTVTKNDENNIYTFNVPLENVTEPCRMIVAIYDENGAVSGLKEVEVSAGDTDKTVTVTAENAAAAKVFLWGDLLNLKPLCDSVEKEIN